MKKDELEKLKRGDHIYHITAPVRTYEVAGKILEREIVIVYANYGDISYTVNDFFVDCYDLSPLDKGKMVSYVPMNEAFKKSK